MGDIQNVGGVHYLSERPTKMNNAIIINRMRSIGDPRVLVKVTKGPIAAE